MADDPSRWLTPKEAAEEFGVATATVTGWAKKGLLPYMKTLGGHRRYSREDIARLVIEAKAEAS